MNFLLKILDMFLGKLISFLIIYLSRKFKNQFKKIPLYYSESPISEEFLKNNIDRL
tara:strand:+ start:621 stop:788 length:168 start_codon:yes stop_codon:yes gene_type:complete